MTGGSLEDHHWDIVDVTVGAWLREQEQERLGVGFEGGLRGSEAVPPLLAAQMAARSAEALCRLCRGQGLGWAYTPAPEWDFANCQVCGLGYGKQVTGSEQWKQQ